MAKHVHEACNYLTPKDEERAKNAIAEIERLLETTSSRVIARYFGISHTAWENWRDGKHDMKASFARHVEKKMLGKVKARDLLGV